MAAQIVADGDTRTGKILNWAGLESVANGA